MNSLRPPFDELMPVAVASGQMSLSYIIHDQRGNLVSSSVFVAKNTLELLRQVAQAHADAATALSRSKKREAESYTRRLSETKSL